MRDIRCLCACCRADYERAGYEIIPVMPIKREPCDKCERMGVNVELLPAKKPNLVFVCSPFGGLVENQELAAKYCAQEVKAGNIPFAPHIFFTWFMSEKDDRKKALFFSTSMIRMGIFKEIHVYEDPTSGMKEEIRAARETGTKVVYMEVK